MAIDIIPAAKANIIVDASKIDLFETCPARYNMRHIRNKTLPLMFKARALDTGGIAHTGLEAYYNGFVEGLPYLDRCEAALLKMRVKAANPNESNSNPDDIKDLCNTLEQYFDFWRAEDENCLEILGIEEPFLYVLFEDDNVRILVSGKIDLICNWNGLGGISSYKGLPWDHKTFSRDGEVLRKSNQFINYCNAVSSNFIWINRIGLYPSTGRNPKTAEEKFKRKPLSYDPVYIADWKENLTKMILQEYLPCVAEDYWPEKPTSCNKFNRLCEYYIVCDSSGKENKERKLETEYIDAEPWDVTKDMVKE